MFLSSTNLNSELRTFSRNGRSVILEHALRLLARAEPSDAAIIRQTILRSTRQKTTARKEGQITHRIRECAQVPPQQQNQYQLNLEGASKTVMVILLKAALNSQQR